MFVIKNAALQSYLGYPGSKGILNMKKESKNTSIGTCTSSCYNWTCNTLQSATYRIPEPVAVSICFSKTQSLFFKYQVLVQHIQTFHLHLNTITLSLFMLIWDNLKCLFKYRYIKSISYMILCQSVHLKRLIKTTDFELWSICPNEECDASQFSSMQLQQRSHSDWN